VQTVGAGGSSGYSNEVSVVPSGAPIAPTGLSTTQGDAQVTVTWSASSGATSYNVLRSTTSGTGYVPIATGITGTSYSNTGLINGTTYYYVVQAVGSGSTSVISAQVQATPTASTPCSNPIVVPNSAKNITLNTTGTACYKVAQTIHGWTCSSWDQRTMSVSGGASSSTCGYTISPSPDGAYYFNVSAGKYSWAAFNWW